jgi:pimeloyl-ACP methyl ester carboxylesterase
VKTEPRRGNQPPTRLGIVVLWMTVLAVMSCGGSDRIEPRIQPGAGAKVGDFSVEACSHVARDVEYPAECGTLVVPENRNDENSKLIALPVKRIPAARPSDAEPIFYLNGGPGTSNLDYSQVEWFHDTHDIVLVGYRGVDGSVFLGCPEVDEAMASGVPLLSREAMKVQGAAYAACADRLTTEGVDLRGYTLLEVVDDIEAARQALGYDRIDLESASYGTRLAQIYAWRYPDRVHRNAMVGVNPPGCFWWDPALLQEQILRYSKLCAEDAYCSSRTDNLVASMKKALDAMPKRWLIFPVDRDAVLFATFLGLYSTDGAARTFDVWLAAAGGDYSGMALISVAFNFMIPKGFAWGDSAAKACSADFDVDPSVDYVAQVTPGPYLLGSPGSFMGWIAAQSWPVHKIPLEYREVQPSDVETLMLSGTLDVSTPAENARDKLLPLFSNAEQVVLESFGHTGDLLYHQPEATSHLLRTFFDSGKVDASRFKAQRISFKPRWGFPLIAKLLVAGVVLALLILLVALRFVWRFVKARRWAPTSRT